MNFITSAFNTLKGYKTYVSAALTTIVAIIYAFFSWDIMGALGMIGLSAQAASLRAAINDMKKGVDEKLFGSD
jgi:hypothetical protein